MSVSLNEDYCGRVVRVIAKTGGIAAHLPCNYIGKVIDFNVGYIKLDPCLEERDGVRQLKRRYAGKGGKTWWMLFSRGRYKRITRECFVELVRDIANEKIVTDRNKVTPRVIPRERIVEIISLEHLLN